MQHQKFWNIRAKTYPTYKDEKLKKTMALKLDAIKNFGIDFQDKTILDIGCGTGNFTFFVARKAKSVLGIDISSDMLKIFNQIKEEDNFENTSSKEMDFGEYDIEKNGFLKNFDIVTAIKTPAISSKEDVERMENCSKEWCIFVGFNSKMENLILDPILKLHDVHQTKLFKIENLITVLKEKGRKYHEFYFDDMWESDETKEEIFEKALARLEFLNVEPKKDEILNYLDTFESKLIKNIVKVNKCVICWRVN